MVLPLVLRAFTPEQFILHEWLEPGDVNLLSHFSDALIQSDTEHHIPTSFNSWITVIL